MSNVPGFPHFHEDLLLIKKNRAKDTLLLLCVVAIVISYAVMTFGTYFDGNSYTGACYSHSLGDDDPIYVYHLCYTPERKAGASSEVLKQLSNGLHTFSCRSTFAAERWGITVEENDKNVQPAGGNTGGGNTGGGNTGGGNTGGQNQCTPGPKALGQECSRHPECSSCDCDPSTDKCRSPPNPNPGGRRLSQQQQSVIKVIPYDNPARFCANVMKNPKSQLRPFANTNFGGGNDADPIYTTDNDKKYNFASSAYSDDEAWEDNDAVYREITAYNEKKMEPSTLTCCGNRLKTLQERMLDWMGVIGGFAGLVHTVFFAISQATAQFGAKQQHSPKDVKKSKQYAREVVVEM